MKSVAFLLVVLSGFPSIEDYDQYVHIRFSRVKWVAAEILVIIGTSVFLTLIIGVVSGLLVGRHIGFEMKYSETVTHYLYYFRGDTGEYVLELIPSNLYNQQNFSD